MWIELTIQKHCKQYFETIHTLFLSKAGCPFFIFVRDSATSFGNTPFYDLQYFTSEMNFAHRILALY